MLLDEMREEVVVELASRIDALRERAKPDELVTGMTGSYVRFIHELQIHTAMTDEEFVGGVYDPWLRVEHIKMYNEINGVKKSS